MPFYTYKCNKCNVKKKTLQEKPMQDGLQCSCGGHMNLQLPNTMEPTVFETVDKWRGVKHRKDQDKRLKKRAKDYFLNNELGDLIARIGVEKATKLGYIKKGKRIKKEDAQ